MKVWLANRVNVRLAQNLARRWRERQRGALEPSSVKHLLVIELGGLGDAVNVLPALEGLRTCLPEASLTIVARSYVKDVFALWDARVRMAGMTKTNQSLESAARELGQTEWDLVVSTCWSTWTTALALKLRTKALVGFWRPWRVDSYGFKPAASPAVSRGDHLALLRFKAVAPLGVQIPKSLPACPIQLRSTDWKSARAKHPHLDRDSVTFIPFCDDRKKSLRLEEACRAYQAMRQFQVPVVLIGGKSEQRSLERMAAALALDERASARLTNLTVPELAAVLGRSRLVASVDTGAMHMAAAVGAPTVGIFKGTDPKRCGPLGALVLTISASQLQQLSWVETARAWLAQRGHNCGAAPAAVSATARNLGEHS